MQWFRWVVVLGLATLGGVRCSETPSGPDVPSPTGNTITALIVSEAFTPAGSEAGAGSAVPVAFVSLQPSTLASAVSVRIRNLSTDGGATTPVPIVDGGFDPVAVPARRLPVVVRTTPTKGRTSVALSVRPAVVFSEPIDPATLPVGMRVVTGGILVSGRFELLPGQPWIAEFVPASPLEPGTSYEMEITQDVHNLVGAGLEAPVTVTFATQPTGEPFEPSLAFVRSAQPGPDGTLGPPSIYVARADGSRVSRLTSGESPAWSPDGRSIAFLRGAEIRLINSDGSGERFLAYGHESSSDPAWSPDGTKIVLGVFDSPGTSGGIFVLDVTMPGASTQLIGNDHANSGDAFYPAWPQWSRDGRSISFMSLGEWTTIPRQFYIMNADGSDPRPLELSAPPLQWRRRLSVLAWATDRASRMVTRRVQDRCIPWYLLPSYIVNGRPPCVGPYDL